MSTCLNRLNPGYPGETGSGTEEERLLGRSLGVDQVDCFCTPTKETPNLALH